jgi:hypothetical protein
MTAMKRSDYEVLGVDRNATKGEIRRRWKAVAYELHPDRGGDPAEFAKVKTAHDNLLAVAYGCNRCMDVGTLPSQRGFLLVRLVCDCRKKGQTDEKTY